MFWELCSDHFPSWLDWQGSGWKTTLLTSVFFLLTSVFFASWNYADSSFGCLIQMLPDVRWVGFLPPLARGLNKDPTVWLDGA